MGTQGNSSWLARQYSHSFVSLEESGIRRRIRKFSSNMCYFGLSGERAERRGASAGTRRTEETLEPQGKFEVSREVTRNGAQIFYWKERIEERLKRKGQEPHFLLEGILSEICPVPWPVTTRSRPWQESLSPIAEEGAHP